MSPLPLPQAPELADEIVCALFDRGPLDVAALSAALSEDPDDEAWRKELDDTLDELDRVAELSDGRLADLVAVERVGGEVAQRHRRRATEPVAAHADWEAEANAALVTRFYAEVWTGGRTALAARFVAGDHVYHDPASPDVAAGPTGAVAVVTTLRRAFPDLAFTLTDVVATGDRVAIRRGGTAAASAPRPADAGGRPHDPR